MPTRPALHPARLALPALGALLAIALCLPAQDPGSMASKVTHPSPCADGQVLKYNATSGLFECQDDLGGGSGGDYISVNGAAADDADFDNAIPAAPANAVNVRWQKDALTPNNLSAHLLFSDLTTATFGSGAGFTWTFNASAGTDPALTLGTGIFNLSAGTLQQAGTPVVLNSRQLLSGSGLSGGGDLSADRTLTVDLLGVEDGAGATASNSGLEFAGASSDQLALLQGCANGQLLKWTATGGTWGCANDNDSGAGTAAWEGLVNSLDTATTYTSNSTAETVTFDFESAFSAGSQFLIRQQTGSPTGGTLAEVRAADADLTALRVQNTAPLSATSWNLHIGDDRSGFSPLAGGLLDPAENIVASLNRATASKYYAFSAVMQDNNTNPFVATLGAVEATHTSGTRSDAGGVEGDAYHTGAGTTNVLAGLAAYTQVDAGAVTSALAVRAHGVTVNNTASVSDAIGLDIGSHTKGASATLGNAIGINVQAQTAGSANYAIRTIGSARSLFGGPVDTGTGYRVNNAAAAGRYLRGNGTNFVASASPAAGTGSCTDQVVIALNDDAAPTCADVTSAMIAADTITASDVAASLKIRSITYIAGCDNCSTLTDADDQNTFFRNNIAAMTLTEVWCESDAGSPTISIWKDDGSPATILSGDITCTTSGATGTITDSALAAGDKLDFVLVTAGGTAKHITLSIKATIN
jgi:hypothetical protein